VFKRLLSWTDIVTSSRVIATLLPDNPRLQWSEQLQTEHDHIGLGNLASMPGGPIVAAPFGEGTVAAVAGEHHRVH
jgi:hypothetical protein